MNKVLTNIEETTKGGEKYLCFEYDDNSQIEYRISNRINEHTIVIDGDIYHLISNEGQIKDRLRAQQDFENCIFLEEANFSKIIIRAANFSNAIFI